MQPRVPFFSITLAPPDRLVISPGVHCCSTRPPRSGKGVRATGGIYKQSQLIDTGKRLMHGGHNLYQPRGYSPRTYATPTKYRNLETSADCRGHNLPSPGPPLCRGSPATYHGMREGSIRVVACVQTQQCPPRPNEQDPEIIALKTGVCCQRGGAVPYFPNKVHPLSSRVPLLSSFAY